jgi:hypothetical protein
MHTFKKLPTQLPTQKMNKAINHIGNIPSITRFHPLPGAFTPLFWIKGSLTEESGKVSLLSELRKFPGIFFKFNPENVDFDYIMPGLNISSQFSLFSLNP